jgi:hypothetical protein
VTESLQALLSELERFGDANDGATADRPRRMLNITRDISALVARPEAPASARRAARGGHAPRPEEMAPFVALVRADAAFATSVVPVGKGEFLAVKSQ